MGEKRRVALKGGIFFYLYYLALAAVFIIIIGILVNFYYTKELDKALLSDGVCVLAGFYSASRIYKKNQMRAVNTILGEEKKILELELSDPRLRRKVGRCVDIAVKFGLKKGVRKLTRLLNKEDNNEDKTAICTVMGALYEAAAKDADARKSYQEALRYSPYDKVALKRLEELTKENM